MVGGHREVYLCNGPVEEGVDRGERADTPQIHALHGQTLPRGHRKGPPGP